MVELLEGENVISKHEELTLTNKRLVKESNDVFSKQYREIPLNKISSIAYGSRVNMFLFYFGIGLCVLTIISFFGIDSIDMDEYLRYLIWPLTLGVIISISSFLFVKKGIFISSDSMTIFESGQRVKPFFKALWKEIYD